MVSATPSERLPTEPGLIKVWFQFTPREGWLPYDTEGLWAARLGRDTARVANIPFLQDGVAEGDMVRFSTVRLLRPAHRGPASSVAPTEINGSANRRAAVTGLMASDQNT
ncbi:hypothetical protein GCM10010404_35440 [Nonomuraea africana]|uniref:DUF4265 domain-containing protein n=1 Tax=Nonomuraea africana TaxID=46171 RepID=UPI001789B077|nr:DUF4265 domain-containing protein [Nonomuraea africana]